MDNINQKILKNLLKEITSRYDYMAKSFSSLKQEVETIKYIDYLTGLLSKEGFLRELGKLIEKAKSENKDKKIFVMTLDLDNFKYINDVYGHEIGDIFLKKIAINILENIDRSNSILGRTGGDEFCIAIYDVKNEEIIKTAEILLQKIENFSLNLGKNHLKTTASIGISIYPNDALDAKNLILRAEEALYEAKQKGKGIFIVFNKELHDRFRRIEEAKVLLNKAIISKNVYPFIQPIFDIKSKKFIGGEILLRIKDGNEFIPAYKFIDVANNFGYIDQLEHIIIEKIIDEDNLKILEDKFIFINKTIKSEKKAGFIKKEIDIYHTMKKEYNITPVIEITESSFVEYFGILSEFIKKLEEKGIFSALDDFGAGYASFRYLLNLDINILKIDGSLIKDILNNKRSVAIVKAISEISKDFGIKTVAEFVENKEILSVLNILDIDYAQGFYLSKPMSIIDFKNFLK
ncbi:hypothetical protein JCM14244_08470 [Venenivibrio stagnispumantis]